MLKIKDIFSEQDKVWNILKINSHRKLELISHELIPQKVKLLHALILIGELFEPNKAGRFGISGLFQFELLT